MIVDGRLTLDAVVSANARWQQIEQQGFSTRRTEFHRPGIPVGLTGILSDVVSARASFDAGLYQGALDLYVDLAWPNGLGLRAGQFLPPLGVEALTGPGKRDFIGRAIVWLNWKPWTARDADVWDPRDLGAMLSYRSSRFEAAAAVINGSGKTAWLRDTDAWKDVCARVVTRPFGTPNTFLAARGYYGRIGDAGTVFRTLATELGAEFGGLRLAGEWQHALSGTHTRTTFYAQSVYEAHELLKPVLRFDASLRPNETDIYLTPGCNLALVGDNVRLMLNYVHRRRMSPNPELRLVEHRVLLQLQAII